MLFNSLEYAVFLPLVFLLYWFVFNKSIKLQNFFLLITGYIFYGWWDWRFLFLMAFSTGWDYLAGLLIDREKAERKRKWLFVTSCVINLGFLGFFKYYNFFIDNLISAFESIGYKLPLIPLNIILPLGISFYTFQSLSYTADIYLKKIKPTIDFISFASFISFFPQLVAGPIERAAHLIPQFQNKRLFDIENAKKGLKEMLWGFFKKIVIADSFAIYVDDIFFNYHHLPGSTLLLGAIYFGIQIYCDFSGYSLIAKGTARLFGFTIMDNFYFPYFSKNPSEFWKNWHISLTSWFKDYVYIPLGGNKGKTHKTLRNILIVFLLSGFWHGANWTFIAWGLINGLLLVIFIFFKQEKKQNEKRYINTTFNIIKISATFLLINLTWIFFRAENIKTAFIYFKGILSPSLFSYPIQHGMALTIPLMILLFTVEWVKKIQLPHLQLNNMNVFLRWSIYLIYSITCLAFLKQNQSFIYFQF